jgi:hypothetical protein
MMAMFMRIPPIAARLPASSAIITDGNARFNVSEHVHLLQIQINVSGCFIFACLPNVATLTRQRANKYNQLILNKKYLSIFQQFSKPVIQNYF